MRTATLSPATDAGERVESSGTIDHVRADDNFPCSPKVPPVPRPGPFLFLKLDSESGLSLPVADLRAQVGNLPKGAVERIHVRRLQLCSIERIEVVDAQARPQPLSQMEGLDDVEVLNPQRRSSQGGVGTLCVADLPGPGILKSIGCNLNGLRRRLSSEEIFRPAITKGAQLGPRQDVGAIRAIYKKRVVVVIRAHGVPARVGQDSADLPSPKHL